MIRRKHLVINALKRKNWVPFEFGHAFRAWKRTAQFCYRHQDNLKKPKPKIMRDPAYSPDIAPFDYHLSRSMQHALSGTHFRNQQEVVNWVDQWIASKDQTFFQRGIATLPERWSKVVQSERNYFQ